MAKKIWTCVIGALFIIAGVFFLINPSQSFNNLIHYVGIVFTIFGILGIVSSLFNKSFVGNSFFISGILALILGLILVFNGGITIKFISILFAVWLILSSILTMFASAFFTAGGVLSTRVLITSILKLICGILIITTPILTFVFSGLVLGIIFIFIGIGVIFGVKEEDTVYKVRVK